MSDRVTTVFLPGAPQRAGLTLRGRATPAHAITQLREMAQRDLEAAQAVLAADPDDFRVETYLGVYAMRNVEVLQEGRKRGGAQ